MIPAPATDLPHPASRAEKKLAAGFIKELRDWRASEGERWIFVAKAMLAAFSALWIAFRLGLDSPNTAMTTTFILALPSSGMVLEKAFYRLLGTLVGCTSALLIVAIFPQQPVALFLALALWIGLCTAGSAMHRNQQSYSFVLAGYTACMIAVPAIDHPTTVFTLAVTRVTEVGLGVICAAVVHDVLFPRHQSRQVMRTVQARYDSFIAFCQQTLEHSLSPAQIELHHLRFAADIAALESGRAAAFFEAAHARAHTRQLHAFNNAFMSALTTCYTLHRLLRRLRAHPPSPVLALIEPLHAAVAAALRGDLAGARMEHVRAALAQQAAQAQAQADLLQPERAERIAFDTALELLDRFVRDIGAFAALYHGLTQQRQLQVSDPVAYSPRTPSGIVLASGVRAAGALLAGATLWYWLAWPYAANAIIMTAIFCALASSSPRPVAMTRQVLAGFLLVWPLSFLTEYLLVVRASGYPMLVLAALPVFALGSYMTTDARRAGVGVGMSMFAAQVIAPLNQMQYDGAVFLNNTLAMPIGVALAWAIFAVLLPEHTMGQKDHIATALWREALATCKGSLFRRKHRFDHRVRDLLSQLNAAAGPAPGAPARAVVRQGLTLLELGHSVIEMRQLIAATEAGAVRNALQLCVDQLAAYFRAPDRASSAAVQYAVLQAGPPIRAALADATPVRQVRLRMALTDLHSIYTSLLDQMPQVPGDQYHAT
ncbi:FUSC family protein [Duganella sp. FT3S]|uniref:FUSC family protein n=1 Tax=Rugamonas fusca TaxID=2758568 RepID=A0A7W2EKG3_9BURK|nr:FUSC family protein [Rugamonas fusca]MBA5607543.1 FUSC family protein [Rugamonas fusca]